MAGTAFYLILNAFRIYIFIRFFNLFLKRSRSKQWIFISCAIYFAVNSAGYLFINNDKLNLILNIGGALIIALAGYQGGIIKKVIVAFACLGISILAEDMAWVAFVKDKSDQMMEFGFFFYAVVFFALEMIIEKTVRLRKEANVSPYKGMMLIVISVGSIFLCSIIIEGVYHNPILLVIALCLLLAIDVSVVYFYEKLLNNYEKRKNEEMYQLQLTMYQNQLRLMQNANDTYKSLRHDMKQHLAMVTDYIQNDEKEKVLEYMAKMSRYANKDGQYLSTGNEGIDSIFNYIIGEINESGGSIETEIKIPEKLPVDDFDMNVILSNLLLNACEAIQQCEKKEVRAVMKYDRGALKISIENTYSGALKIKGEEYLSTKQMKGEHGIGLGSVKRTVEKYDGEMNISHTEDRFKVEVLLYI
ncbi:MAG: ATP-binding protein [Lachnospiraceae bacterium]|nr:ATP-binding protein [Lachnospiraceae bacterium]